MSLGKPVAQGQSLAPAQTKLSGDCVLNFKSDHCEQNGLMKCCGWFLYVCEGKLEKWKQATLLMRLMVFFIRQLDERSSDNSCKRTATQTNWMFAGTP